MILDRVVQPEWSVLGLPRSAFQVCGALGLLVGAGLLMSLGRLPGTGAWVLPGLMLVSAVMFLLLAMATKAVLGRPRLVFYQHAALVLLAGISYLRVVGAPVLGHLDLLVLFVGSVLGFGRIGCLMVGCCYGLPHPLGVAYREEHAVCGFDHHLVGVRLFPTQLLEAIWSLGLVIAGTVMVRRGAAPGEVLAMFALLYAAERFVLEFARGDAHRPIAAGFSEAQWTSLAVAGAIVVAERLGWLPAHGWHVAVATALAFALFFVVAWRYLASTARHHLLHPQHLVEVATTLAQLRERQPGLSAVVVGSTSLGIQISRGQVKGAHGPIEHFAISQADDTMSEETARIVLELIGRLQPHAGRSEIRVGRPGVFHLLLHPIEPITRASA